MLRGFWGSAAKLLVTGATVVGLATAAARADDKDLQELRQRMEKLESQNEELRRNLDNVQRQGSAPSVVPASMTTGSEQVIQAAAEAAKKAEEAPKVDEKDKWLEVGKNLGLKGVWVSNQPWLESEDKAFRFHVGARTQMDVIWGRATDRVQTGVGGTGNISDAVNFRRGRLEVDGWIFETMDYFFEYDFFQTINDDPTLPANEASVINSPCPTDAWASVNYLPILGTVRAGNMKPPISVEHITSSRWLDFLERSPLFDTYFNRNNGFEPGIQMTNWTENERLTWAVGMFKNNNSIMGWNVSDGDYQVNGRITCLPFYQDEGRCMVHLGFGAQYDAPDNGVAQLRDRWLLRNGPPTLHNTVGQAFVRGEDQVILMPEFFMNFTSDSFSAAI